MCLSCSEALDETDKRSGPKRRKSQLTEFWFTGEVLDMACYIDHAARGEGHRACARSCIQGGTPIGLLTSKGKVYLLARPLPSTQGACGRHHNRNGNVA